MENSEIKHGWVSNAIHIYSSELHHREEIRAYHQSVVDAETGKINGLITLIADLEGKAPIQPELDLDVPKLKSIIAPRFSPIGIIRYFTGKI